MHVFLVYAKKESISLHIWRAMDESEAKMLILRQQKAFKNDFEFLLIQVF